MIKNRLKKASSVFKARKMISVIVFAPVLLAVIALALVSHNNDTKTSGLGGKEKSFIGFVERPKAETINPDGTMNGINLLLISTLGDSYIKEYLELCKSNQEGLLNDKSSHTSVETIIALNMAEQGPYRGTPIPCSYLPWDSSTNSILWNKESSGLPAEALTLAKANKNVIGGKLGSGPIAPYPAADTIAGDPANGGTASPFQIGLNWIKLMGKSNKNGYNTDDSRDPDIIYFPDQLNYIDSIGDKVLSNYFNLDDLDGAEQSTLASIFFASGEGNACNMEFPGIGTGTDDESKSKRLESWTEYKKSLELIDEAYGKQLAKYATETGEYHQLLTTAISIAAVEVGGWKFEDDEYLNTLLSKGFKSYQILHPSGTEEEFKSLVESNTRKSGGFYIARTSWCRINYTSSNYSNNSENIAFGHTFMTMCMGKYYYSYMLKMGGLTSVDPDNPSTYMNQLKESGEWTPSGDGDWIIDAGVNKDLMNDKRAKVLNEAHKLLGTKYGNTRPINQFAPPKNTNGTYDVSQGTLDCSGLTWKVYNEVFGIDIGSNTYSQASNSNLEIITEADLKPGDLIQPHPGHVIIYLSGNRASGITYLHTGNTRDNACIVTSNKYYCNVYPNWVCLRYTEIDK